MFLMLLILDSSAGYAQSKFANAAFVREIAKRLAKEQILAFTLHPGGVLTNGAENLPKDVWTKYGTVIDFTIYRLTRTLQITDVLDH